MPRRRAASRSESDEQLAIAQASDPTTSPEQLVRLSTSVAEVQLLVARHPSCPVGTLSWFADFATGDLARAVASHPCSSPGAIERLLDRPHSTEVYAAVAGNPSTPVEILRLLAQRQPGARESLAANPSCPPDLMVELINLGHTSRVAANPSCPPALLEELVSVRRLDLSQVAGNPSAPASLLGQLATHRYTNVRRTVAANPACPPDVLTRLSRDRVYTVRAAVAAHPALPSAVRRDLMADPRESVREVARAHMPTLPVVP